MAKRPRPEEHEPLLLQALNLRAARCFDALAATVSCHLRHTAQISDSFVFMEEMSRRMAAMGSFHQLLSRKPSPVTVLETCCREICLALLQAFGREEVTPWLRMGEFPLTHLQEQLVTLLVAELMTEVLALAPLGEEATVWIELKRAGPADLELSVQNSLSGPFNVDEDKSLALALARALAGTLRRSSSGSCGAVVQFPEVAPLRPVIEAQGAHASALRRSGISQH